MDSMELLKLAEKAKENAYAPYSKFKVGAALLAKSGRVFSGCNVECASYGGTNCAERTAVFKAVSEGEKEFVKIAVASSKEDETFPCGICRQVLSEFAHDIIVVLGDSKKGILKEYSMDKDLLPNSFLPSDL
ncbi:MAG: cytidine deaminase [Peptostreptococcaceae bacterium]|nr:cytidine deaminase [Peptostreptococcaceae bacterium]